MKNIKDLGERTAIQFKTQEEWDFVTKELKANNLIANYWRSCKVDTCIRPSDNTYGRLNYFINEGYTIHQASDFMPLSPQDEIKELKERIATLEESLRPKKKIEFVKHLCSIDMCLYENFRNSPKKFNTIEVLQKHGDYDILKCTDSDGDVFIYLGHFNDGEK